ncbi:DUF4176 domain-containing protein [Metabacillus iocasae]|uniref:DUF4176 domain-containing protein n=1 Tax=Priestia iocasae TaxID=2291674 RepID=A0ABS2QZL7_9BACI|nr:DUF4176 domain-containing protein [Metabacillus iocasae]MBM7704397.1 hypothetical protein [Metabacillus iocasae]
MANEINSLVIDKGTDLLPIGTVVLLDIIAQPLMIYGRMQQQANKEGAWDYVACPYPQGHISDETNVFFNHVQIKQVVFKGFESEGEKLMKEKLRSLQTRDESDESHH